MNSVDAASYRFQFEIGSKESTMDFVQENVQDYQNEQVYDRYEQLQQIRILMTADAGLFLAKQGVNLNAEPIASLIEQLDAYHQAVHSTLRIHRHSRIRQVVRHSRQPERQAQHRTALKVRHRPQWQDFPEQTAQ